MPSHLPLGRREFLAGLAGFAGTSLTLRGAHGNAPGLPATDYTQARHRDRWLHHPILGDPSWDTFTREPGNPIHTGRPPYLWPVNGFLFRDPPSGRWYAFISVYPRGYWPPPPANCLLMRERAGGGWEEAGMLFEGDPHGFMGDGERSGAMTDASVVYEDGKYYLLYGWCDPKNARGGLACATAEHPEGPWRLAPAPLHEDTRQKPIMGRYVRAYASTLFRRKEDWLILHMMSTPGNAGGTWALFCMTAPNPEGPCAPPIPLLYPQSDRFHPPLAEFYPAFAHEDYLYAPATSVALNRTFQVVFRAPIEKAHKAAAWSLHQYGSVWHSEPTVAEAQGIWGQTFSGQIMPDGTLRAYFTSKTPEDVGTVHLARRPWKRPYRDGFVLSAPRGPAVALLHGAREEFTLTMAARANSDWAVCWDCRNPLGSNHHLADSSLHPLVRTHRVEWRRRRDGWTLVQLDSKGEVWHIANGNRPLPQGQPETVELARNGTHLVMRMDGVEVWAGNIPGGSGRLELLAETGTILKVERFSVQGSEQPARVSWLATEALAGAASAPEEWKTVTDARFRFGIGCLSARPEARAKWNYAGRGFRLFAPRGPDFGRCRVLVDGREAAVLDLSADTRQASVVVLERRLKAGLHAVVLVPVAGVIPCDTLEIMTT